MTTPYIIEFNSIGDTEIGYLCVNEFENLPFKPKRIFWTFHTPESIVRGRHAHHETEMILIAVSGTIIVNTEDINSNILSFKLDKPNKGLFIPKLHWHTMLYSVNAVQLVLASTNYNETDYIRNYEIFQNLNKLL